MTTSEQNLCIGPGLACVRRGVHRRRRRQAVRGRAPDFCVAAVTQGTFRYRTRQGMAMLAPGAILLGNPGACYRMRPRTWRRRPLPLLPFCPGLYGSHRSRGARREATWLRYTAPAAPAGIGAAAGGSGGRARDGRQRCIRGNRLCALPAAAAAVAAGTANVGRAPSRRDQKRVAEAVRRIEARCRPSQFRSAELAGETATSPYHFLRTFRHVAGMTPYQFLLKTRLHRAAVRLRTSDEADLCHRLRGRLQRPVDLQPPLPADHGAGARRLSRPAGGSSSVAPLCPGGGEKRFGHIVAIDGILLKSPPKLSLEKPSPTLEFRPRFLYKQPVIPNLDCDLI